MSYREWVKSSSFGSKNGKGVEMPNNVTMIKDIEPTLDNITVQGRMISLWHNVIGSVVAIGDVVPVQSSAGRKIRRSVVIEDAELIQPVGVGMYILRLLGNHVG
ncbi:hypothetical protein Tco_1365785 [Tanacetum coccineum]